MDNYQFTIDTTQYRSMQKAIDSMTKLAAIMFAASILMGAVVLVMMLMINLKDREFELGVLLSMGENKAKIIGQMMLESLFPVLCAMTAAVFCSGWMQQIFANLFTTVVDLSLTPITIFEMYLAGFLLTLKAAIRAEDMAE